MRTEIARDRGNRLLKTGGRVLGLCFAVGIYSTVRAQAPAGAGGAAETLEEITVTGSRIARQGFDAPTPTTVVGLEEIQKAAPANIADFVNELPQLSASATPRVGNANTSSGFNGLNNLNLRALGANRTLVLLDGQRVASSGLNGAVDINNLPSALVQRIEVVTGGASAVYGSDAVAGVVNFILDKEFSGLKGNVSAGRTSRGDDDTTTASLSFGNGFADGAGHVLLSAEYGYVQGIDYLDPSKRDWFRSVDMLTFGSSVTPQRIVRDNVNARFVAEGGLITSGPAVNTQFGANGAPLPFVVGSPANSVFMVGGNTWYEGNAVALDAMVNRHSLFSRVSYDLAEDLTLSFDASYGYSHTRNSAAYQRYPGNGGTALVMSRDNPFLDPAIAAMYAPGATFTYGYSSAAFGRPVNDAERKTYRGASTLSGSFGQTWNWDVYYQYGQTNIDVRLYNTTNRANFRWAIDAVRDPATGRIICNPANTNAALASPGCVPLNIFGIGVADPAAIRYVQGVALQELELKQNVGAFSVNGQLFDIWAGPVSMAAGAEYRKEEIEGSADSVSLRNGFFTGNYKPTIGDYDVKEAFVETLVPLARDVTGIESLEFNGAARYTDYSLSGSVTTWKLGLTYVPFRDLRLRGVRSRDIRAPNLGELFQAGQTQRLDVIDTSQPSRPSVSITRVTSGNQALTPEIAETTSFGVVYQPSWLPQLTTSVDFYSIDITDAISTLSNQETVDRCVRGEAALCSLVVRNSAGTITEILGIPINVAEQETEGFDIEASWRQTLGSLGTLTVRALASHIKTLATINSGIKTEAAGQNTGNISGSAPDWRWLGSIGFERDPWSLNLTARGFSAGVYDNTFIEGISIEDNDIPGATYFDLGGAYQFEGDFNVEAFFKIENLMDKDPEVVAGNNLSALQTNPALYDVVGRNYRVGVRFEF